MTRPAPVPLTRAAYLAIHHDYRGYSPAGVPQLLTVGGIVDVELVEEAAARAALAQAQAKLATYEAAHPVPRTRYQRARCTALAWEVNTCLIEVKRSRGLPAAYVGGYSGRQTKRR